MKNTQSPRNRFPVLPVIAAARPVALDHTLTVHASSASAVPATPSASNTLNLPAPQNTAPSSAAPITASVSTPVTPAAPVHVMSSTRPVKPPFALCTAQRLSPPDQPALTAWHYSSLCGRFAIRIVAANQADATRIYERLYLGIDHASG